MSSRKRPLDDAPGDDDTLKRQQTEQESEESSAGADTADSASSSSDPNNSEHSTANSAAFSAGYVAGYSDPPSVGPDVPADGIIPAVEGDEFKTEGILLSLRVLLGSKSIGAIIGKQGAQINQFRNETGAQINVDKQVAGASKRVVTIQGSSEQLSALLCSMASKLSARKKEGQDAAPGEDSRQSITILVPNVWIGSIMGRQGAKIAVIRTTSGASIKVSEKTLEDSTEKTITVQGSGEQMTKAITQICRHVMEAQAMELAGIKAGKTSAVTVPYVPKPDAATSSLPFGQLPYGSAYSGLSLTASTAASPYSFTGFSASDPYAAAGGGGGVTSVTIPVPDNMAGSVIGRNGSMISSIRQRSGSTIKISDRTSGSTDRQVTLTGTKAQNDLAYSLIYEIINSGSTADSRSTASASAAVTSAAAAAAAAAYPYAQYSYSQMSALGMGAMNTLSAAYGVPASSVYSQYQYNQQQ